MLFHNLALLSGLLLYLGKTFARPAPNGQHGVKRVQPKIASTISKRAQPGIDEDTINPLDPNYGGKLISDAGTTNGAFDQAIQLLNYAVTVPDSTRDPIFKKYFNIEDKATVLAIFNRLVGPDQQTDANEFAGITVTAAETPDDDPTPAELLNYNSMTPTLTLDPERAFVLPNRDDDPNACQEWEEQGMTTDMYLLASVLLHEYVHWDGFLADIHMGQVIDQDDGYGFRNARALDKTLAIYNADSYSWFATETLWSVLCSKNGGYDDRGAD